MHSEHFWYVFCGSISYDSDSVSAVLLVQRQADTVRCRDNAVNFLTNFNERHPIARPLGLLSVDPASAWFSDPVSLIIYVISYNIGPRYNGTRLYDVIPRYIAWLWLVVCIRQFTGKQSLASEITRNICLSYTYLCGVYTTASATTRCSFLVRF